jgi:hypothetical protein
MPKGFVLATIPILGVAKLVLARLRAVEKQCSNLGVSSKDPAIFRFSSLKQFLLRHE